MLTAERKKYCANGSNHELEKTSAFVDATSELENDPHFYRTGGLPL